MTSPAEPDPRPDLWLGGRLSLLQPPRGAHRAGTDAVLLARLLAPAPGAVLCDVGAGAGTVGLAYARLFPEIRAILVEKQPELAEMAAANAAANGLSDRVQVVAADILAPGRDRAAAGLNSGLADLVATNPPFFEGRGRRVSPHPGKVSAHDFGPDDLERWLRTCCDLLRPGGTLGMIHRSDHLPRCLAALEGRFGAIAMRAVHARTGQPAIRVLIRAIKGSRAPFSLLPPLVLHGEDGAFTAEAQALHNGESL